MGKRRLRRPDCAEKLELEIVPPDLFGQIVHVVRRRSAGVVDQDVQPAEMIDRLLDEGFGLTGHRHVGPNRQDLTTGQLAQLLGRLLERVLAPPTDGDPRALLGQPQGRRLADPIAPPGNRRHFATQPKVHVSSSSCE